MHSLSSCFSARYRLFIALFVIVLLSACSSSTRDSRPGSERELAIGHFIDSAVWGLGYSAEDLQGITDSVGRFDYREGGLIRFSLAGVVLGDGDVPALDIMTPRDLFNPKAELTDRRALNLARILLSLDAQPDNPLLIDVREAANVLLAADLSVIELDVEADQLLIANPKIATYLQANNIDLVATDVAQRHLQCSEQDIAEGRPSDGRCDEDDLPLLFAQDISEPEGDEQRVLNLVVQLSSPAEQAVTVDFRTVNGSAIAGEDYVATSGTLEFAPGQTEQSVAITILGDITPEPDESFFLDLDNPVNAELSKARYTVTLLNDDTAAGQVVLTLTAQTFTEGTGDSNTQVLYRIQRSGGLERNIDIRVSTSDQTAQAGEDYLALDEVLFTIPAQQTEFDIPLQIVADDVLEADETFLLSVTAVSDDVTVTGSPATVTIRDDDMLGGALSLSLDSFDPVPEGNAEHLISLTARLNRAATEPVSLLYSTRDGSATSQGEKRDFEAVTQREVIIPAGQLTAALPVRIFGDQFEEFDEQFELTLDGGVLGQFKQTITLTNDDELTLLQVGAASQSVTPANAHIAGMDEPYFGGVRKQFFHLGGFGFGPFKLLPGFGPFPEVTFGDAPVSISNAAAAAPCFGPAVIDINADADHHDCEDETWVRVMVMIDPVKNERIAMVTLDAVGAGNLVQDAVKKAVNEASCQQDLCIPVRNVLFGQTHTHAGADLQGLWGGVPKDWQQKMLFDGVKAATHKALTQRKPAQLSLVRGDASDFNSYRRPKYRDESIFHRADPAASLLMAKADDESNADRMLATLAQFSAHPTSVGANDFRREDGSVVRVPHPDYPLGVVNRLEQQLGGTALYFNGAIADASAAGPATGSNKYEQVKSRGENLANLLLALRDNAVPVGGSLSVAHSEAILPITNPLFIGVGLLSQFNGYYQFSQLPFADIPGLDRIPAEFIDAFEGVQNQLPQPTPVARTLVSRITLGLTDANAARVEIVTIPGEATNTFGQYIRSLAGDSDLAEASPQVHTMLLGLTHNSFGYIIPEDEFSYIDPAGDIVGYEEIVSLGPLTAPLLRAQAYNPLFGVAPPDLRFLPPLLTDCLIAYDFGACFVGVGRDRLLQAVGVSASFFDTLSDGAKSVADGCRGIAGPLAPGCMVFDGLVTLLDAVPNPADPGNGGPGGGLPGAGTDDLALLSEVILASSPAGCDFLDPAHCLLPFPNNHFTQAANTDTGRQLNLSLLATPRNVLGKPIDPSDQNRADGFSPGSALLVRVPGLDLDKTAEVVPMPRLGRPDAGQATGAVPQSMANSLHPDSAVVVFDVTDKKPHLVWAELDANLTRYTPCDLPAPVQTFAELGDQAEINNAVQTFRDACNQGFDPIKSGLDMVDPINDQGPLLIIRPGVNFEEGRRYIVALRQLHDANGQLIEAGAGFRLCRDNADSLLRSVPAVASRCAALDEVMQILETDAGIAREELYLAWDFTVASQRSLTTRLLGMRDQTLKDKATPNFKIGSVENNPCEAGATDCVARVIKGTMSIPNFIDRPLKPIGQSDVDRQITGRFWFGKLLPGPYDAPKPFPLQPTVDVPFTCHVPNTVFESNGDVRPSRVSLYGHGLFGSQGEIGQGQLRRFGNEHNFTFCAADWIGMSGVADVVNAITVLLDMSNFPTLADRVQQGILNFVVMGRLLKADDGFVSHPAFQAADGRPLIDNRHVFFDGNSQGGIDGGVVVAVSPDVHRGVLGVPGMNYNTLLQRSVDFDGYARLFYPAYPNTVDQQLALGLAQMLWDRSENNGYAQHLGDGVAGTVTVAGKTHVIGSPNTTLPGLDGQPLPPKEVLLHVGFGDHQVSMTSAEVMARTIGANGTDVYFRRPSACSGDVTHCFNDRDSFMARHPDVDPYLGLDLLRPDSAGYGDGQGSFLMVFDEGKTATPPADNRPPKADSFDPHEYPRNQIMARCQKARFLRDDGALIYTDLLTNPVNCPVVRGDGVPFVGDAVALAPGQGGGPVDPPVAAPDYGSGVLGTVAEFVSALNEAFMALIEGDMNAAFAFGQQAFSGLGANVIGMFAIGDDSLFTTGSETFAAAPDPQSMFSRLLSGLGRFLGLQDDPLTTLQALGSAERNSEAVVISGAQLLGWAGPAAIGVGFPYPSGAATTGDPFPAPLGNIRSAHNGTALDPAFGQGPNVPVEQIAAYAFRNGEFVEIPVQVDERMPYFLANGNSSFSTYSGTDMEINYVWDIERWDLEGECFQNVEGKGAKPDPAAGLDMDDEVVFMAQDAGELVTNPLDVVAWADGRPVQQILVVDPLAPGIPKAVYLVVQEQGSSFRQVKDHYVRYQRNADADQWIDRHFFSEDDPEKLGTSNTGYGSNLTGTVCADGTPATARTSTDRFPRDGLVVETDTYRFEASGRWMKRDLRIRRPGDDASDPTYWESRPDLIDRWKGRAFQQSPDSVISLVGFEDEQVNWEANSILVGERCGPVRCMREVWGADSGTNVTKTETFYRDAVAYRYRVRVHPIPPDGLYTSWDYNRSAMVPEPGEQVPGGRYYTMLRPQGVPIDGINDDIGQIDGHMPIAGMCIGSDGPVPANNGLCPMFFDVADPTFNLPLAFNNWEQVSAKGSHGSLVYIFALKGATALANPVVVPYYRDDACLDDGTGDDPVARPYPGESYQWRDGMVPATYDLLAGRALDHSGNTFADCLQRQGAHAAHGIHFLVTHDTDNAFTPLTTTEIDGEQWQFMVPTDAPKNVGDRYANVIRVPLISVALPLSAPVNLPVPELPIPGISSASVEPALLQRLMGGFWPAP